MKGPFKQGCSYGWLLWVVAGVMIAAVALHQVFGGPWLWKGLIAAGILIEAGCEWTSGYALDKSFVASISRREEPFFFWFGIAFKVAIVCFFLVRM